MTARCLRYDVSSSTFEEEEYDQGGPERISLDFRLPAGGTRNAALYHLLSRDIPWLRPVRDLDPEGFWLLDLSALRRFKVFGPVPWMAGVANSRPITYPRDNGEWTIRFELSRAELAWLGRQADFRDLKPALDRFHDAFETSEHLAFIITPFVGSGLYASASDAIRNTLESVGLRGLRADDKALADDLLTNVRAYMHGCGLGVAVCGGETSDQVNRNVSIEIGYMMALGKPVCLLRTSGLRALPTDLVGRLYLSFSEADPLGTIPPLLRSWLRDQGFDQEGDNR